MQKFLLGTDGSVTQILEAITGKPVAIETRVQKIIKADPGHSGLQVWSFGLLVPMLRFHRNHLQGAAR